MTGSDGSPAKSSIKNPWLHAWYDPVAGINAFNGCISLADAFGDGDYKLLIADADRRLKVYKGTSIYSEIALLGFPVALETFYTDTHQPKTPAVAVACGSYIYIYRNLRPYFKFSLPKLDIHKDEIEIWDKLSQSEIEIPQALEELNKLREQGIQLSLRSMDLLAMEDIQQQIGYISRFIDTPLVQLTSTTCMTTLKKSMEDADAVSCLVVGTECKQILILDPQGTTVKTKCMLPSIPVTLQAVGLYDVEYRIVVACRNGIIYTVKNGELLKTSIHMESQPCGLIILDKSIIVSSMDNKLASFHFKGKKNWNITLPCAIVNIEVMNTRRSKSGKGVLVALQNGQVALYAEKLRVAEVQTEGPATAMLFGQYGREENSLVIIHRSGAITLKMLQRNATFESQQDSAGPPPEQDIPLNIPKKTKLYVEQTQRERDHAVDMHRLFQRDLCRLRLSTARAYVKIITDGQGPASFTSETSIRINAQVRGIGPLFKLIIKIQNTSKASVYGIPIAIHFDHNLYKVDESLFTLPLLIPGAQYHYEFNIQSISETGVSDSVYIFVCSKESSVPIASAVVNMPISEPLLE